MKYSIARGVAHPPVSCYNSPMTETECVLAALCALRAPRTTNEYDLHRLVAEALDAAGLKDFIKTKVGSGYISE